MSDGRLLVDVADAITSNQEVDWNRARGASRPGHGRALDNLRALSAIFATHRPQGAVSASLSRERLGTAFARLALGSLVALSALQVAAALVTTAWSWDFYLDRQFALPRLLVLVSLSACALLLLRGGGFDRRAQLLGGFFALGASSFSFGFRRWALGEIERWSSGGFLAGAHVGVRTGVSAGPSTNPDR